VFYDGLVVPGALLLLGSGTWLTITVYGGWAFLRQPWLAGMVALFAFEFIEGNTITRLYFMRLRRLTKVALEQGSVTRELETARREHLPTFTHFLDLPIFFVIVALGAMAEHLDALPGRNGPSRRCCDRPRGCDSTAISLRACNQAMIRGHAGHGPKRRPPPELIYTPFDKTSCKRRLSRPFLEPSDPRSREDGDRDVLRAGIIPSPVKKAPIEWKTRPSLG
jgi:hypothetical protein